MNNFYHSNIATSELKKKQIPLGLNELKLVQSCPTRWDSSYFMCLRLLDSRAAVVAVLSDRNITSLKIALKLEVGEKEWREMEGLVKLLKPLQVATTVVCDEKNVTSSLVRPIVLGLIYKHMQLSCDENISEDMRTFVKTVKAELQKKIFIDRKDTDQVLSEQISSFPDPRYKNLEFEKTEIRSIVKNHVQDLIDNTISTGKNQVEGEAVTAMDFLLDATASQESISEFDMYVCDPQLHHNIQDSLMWWNNNEKKIFQFGYIGKKIFICTSFISNI